jgi:hypothetical protein
MTPKVATPHQTVNVHCKEGIDGGAMDLRLPSSKNSICWHKQI